jgi:hypothetical protein
MSLWQLPASTRLLASATDCQDFHVLQRKGHLLSTPPRLSERKRTSAPAPANNDVPPSPVARRPPLAQRLAQMSDHQLVSYQVTASRIIADVEHPKHATALRALPKIEKEIERRATDLATTPAQDDAE